MNCTRSSATHVLGGLVAVGAVPAWLMAGDPISQTKWTQIQKGMKKEEVLTILGTPDRYDGNQIEYSRFLNQGWVEFAFDEKDELIWKNDESVFGSLP